MPSTVDVALRTVVDTARVLSVSRTTVYALCEAGELEGVKLGGLKSMRITQESIDRYIKNAKRKPRKED